MEAAVSLLQPLHCMLGTELVHPGYKLLLVMKVIVKSLQGKTALLHDLLDRDAVKIFRTCKRQNRVTEYFLG